MTSPQEKKEQAIAEIEAKIETLFAQQTFTTPADLLNFRQQLYQQVEQGRDPLAPPPVPAADDNETPPHKSLSSADQEIYLAALERQLGKLGELDFAAQQTIAAPLLDKLRAEIGQLKPAIAAKIKQQLGNVGGDEFFDHEADDATALEKLRAKVSEFKANAAAKIENNPALLTALAFAADEVMETYWEQTQARRRVADKRAALAAWSRYKGYREYRKTHGEKGLTDEAYTNLGQKLATEAQWHDEAGAPPQPKAIFSLAYELEQKIEQILQAQDDPQPVSITALEKQLLELKRLTDEAANPRVSLIHDRLKDQVDDLMSRRYRSVLIGNLRDRIVKIKNETQKAKLLTYIDHLEALWAELGPLLGNGFSMIALNDKNRAEISQYLNTVEDKRLGVNQEQNLLGDEFATDLAKLHEQITLEAWIVLGQETTEPEFVFDQGIEAWLQGTMVVEINWTRELWERYQAAGGDRRAFNQLMTVADWERLGQLGRDFAQQKARLIQAMQLDPDQGGDQDPANNKRLIALDVFSNRIAEMLQAREEGGEGARAVAGGEGEELTETKVLKEDILNFSSQELIRRAKFLWGVLFAELEMLKTESKQKYFNKYMEIVRLLKRRGLSKEAEYLELRTKFYELLVVGTSSAWTVDYDALYEGGKGWKGLKTQAEITEEEILRLLFGSEIRVNPEDLTSQEEKEFYKKIQMILMISYELMLGYDPETDSFRDVDGPYHAFNVNYTKNLRSKFKEQVKVMLLEELQLSDSEKSELSAQEEEIAGLGNQALQFLDVRTYVSLLTFLAGKSAKSGDPAGDTLSKYTARFTGLKDLYVAVGKNNEGFVVPEMLVRQIPDSVKKAVEPRAKKQNNLALAEYATDLYSHFYAAAHWDDGETVEARKVIYKPSPTQNPVPLICEALWPPRTRYVKEVGGKIVPATLNEFKSGVAGVRRSRESDSGVSPAARNAIFKAAGSPDGVGRGLVTIKGYLAAAAASEKFIQTAQEAFPVSGNIEADVDQVASLVTKLANKISPTKSLSVVPGAVDTRRFANHLLMCMRYSALAFGQKYAGDEEKRNRHSDYFRYYAQYLKNMRVALVSAATNDITIGDEYLPPEFKRKYGFPLNGKITISSYVWRFLPDVKEEIIAPGAKLIFSGVDSETAKLMRASLSISPVRVANNEEDIKELQGKKKNPKQTFQEKKNRLFRLGPLMSGPKESLLHNRSFHPPAVHPVEARDPGDPRVVFDQNGHVNNHATAINFYNAIHFPPLAGDKSIKEKSGD